MGDEIVMSLASGNGVCYVERKSKWYPISDSYAVEVVRGNETVTLQPWYEPYPQDRPLMLKGYAWAPRVTGTISVVSSVIILWVVLRDHRSKLTKTRYRLLTAMSIADIVNSIALALSSAPIPAGTYGTYGALGTRGTCSAQGFFVQLGFAEPAYSCMLSVYFAMVIHFRVRERSLRWRVEPFMHAIVLSYALGTASAGLALDLFNSSGTMCWIEPYPHGCSAVQNRDTCVCTRGVDAFFFQVIFGGAPLLVFLLVIFVMLGFILYAVWRLERRMRVLNAGGPPSARDAQQIKAAAMSAQSFLYIWAFVASYSLPVFMGFAQEADLSIPRRMHLLMYTFMPLQGLWNFLAFLHPRWKFARSFYPRATKWKIFKLAILGDAERTRGGGARALSALNGEFEPRQFRLGTVSLRTGSAAASGNDMDGVRDFFSSDSDDEFSDYVESRHRWDAQSTNGGNGVSFASDVAVDMQKGDESTASRVESFDFKTEGTSAGEIAHEATSDENSNICEKKSDTKSAKGINETVGKNDRSRKTPDDSYFVNQDGVNADSVDSGNRISSGCSDFFAENDLNNVSTSSCGHN